MRAKIAGIGLAGLALSFGANAQQHAGMNAMPVAPIATPMIHPGVVAIPVAPAHVAPVGSASPAGFPGVAHHTVAAASNAVPGSVPHTVHPSVPRKVSHPVNGNAPSKANSSSSSAMPNGGDFFADDDGYPVPGLGFDYPHYFATHPNANHHQGTFNGAVFPFVGGGIYLPIPTYGETGASPAGEQTAENGNTDGGEATAEPAEREAEVAPRAHVRAESKPSPVSEYVFVKRDGTVFFAVAYSVVNARLQYVTKDGFRRIVPMDALDLDATQQFNEQRGLSFRAPA